MDNPLALHPFEVALFLSQLLTVGLWALLVWGVMRRSWPVGPALVLGLLTLIPLAGPIIGATGLYVAARSGSRARTIA